MDILNLCWSFFKVGLFTIGGGLVAIPIMQEYVLQHGWVTKEAFVNMIAVSQSTPGPIGINLATYVGFTQYGIWGSIMVTVATVLPSYIVIYLIHKYMHHINEKPVVLTVFKTIRPVVIGVILSAAYSIAILSFIRPETLTAGFNLLSFFDIKGLAFFAVFFGTMFYVKLHPIVFILLGGVIGIFVF